MSVLIFALAPGGCDSEDAKEPARSDAPPSTTAKATPPQPKRGPVMPEVLLKTIDPTSPELERAASAWIPTIRACYAPAVREDERAAGSVDVAVSGGVSEVTTPGLTESVRHCVAEAARSWDFAAFGATGDVRVHFDARPRAD